MIPFLHFFKPQYLFWSNERNCSQAFPDDEGFLVNATFDQSGRWLQTLNTMLRLFSCNTQLGSILESVTQIADFYLLHKRYPTLGKYYVTCQGEDSKKVWCGRCDDCATFFLFFKAFEFDPKIAGLVDDMFATKKIKYLKCFNHQDEKQRMWMQFWKYHKQEKELALEICLQKKMKSPLLSVYQEYKKKNAHSNYTLLKKEYLSVHQSTTTPPELQKKLFAIFEGELSKLRREI